MKSLKLITAAMLIAAWIGPANGAASIVGEYLQETSTGNFNFVSFSPVPAGKLLIIKHVSCRMQNGPMATVDLGVENPPNSQVLNRRFPLVITSSQTSTVHQQATANPDLLVPAGKAPGINFGGSFGGQTSATCSIIGKLFPASALTGYFD